MPDSTDYTDRHRRMQWFREYGQCGNARRVCRRYGISAKTFYK